MENITKEQADIIGEVANICTGTAATALSMIINRSTNITTPLVEVLDKENTLESDNHILVKVPYTRLRRDKSYGPGCSGCAGHCKSYDGR